jgi:hypothetical protein
MSHPPIALKIAVFFCCHLVLAFHSCKAESCLQGDSQICCRPTSFVSRFEQQLASLYEIGIEAIAFKTDEPIRKLIYPPKS